MRTMAEGGGVGGVLILAVALGGCFNVQTYGTPRTTPAGQVLHIIGAEGVHTQAKVVESSVTGVPTTHQEGSTLPMLPTYQIRFGVADRFDVGIRVPNLTGVGLDAKWNFLRTQGFDLAIQPAMQGQLYADFSHGAGEQGKGLMGHAPLIAGINTSRDVTLVFAAGPIYAFSSRGVVSDYRTVSDPPAGFGVRGAVGVQLRVSKRFAVQPEVTIVRFFAANEILVALFGVGFVLGGLPSYEPKAADPP